uniref:Putative guanine nucleotide exchange factor tim n=1 Tax=Culex tarsalis TaxID=7177 RepID=A0A1Q3G0Y3_CULTA
MYSSRTLPASVAPPPASGGEKRPTVDKQQSFIQRFYLFGTNPNSSSSSSSSSSSGSSGGDSSHESSPAVKKSRKKLDGEEGVSHTNYSVQRLKQFWNNRLSIAAAPGETSEIALSRKLKSVTLGPSNPSRKPATPEFLRRNGSTRGSASRRNIVRNSLVPLYSNLGAKKTASPKVSRVSREVERNDSLNQKRSSVVLSPVRDPTKDKRSCLDRVGYNAGFPLVTATANGGRINWARRAELLGIRSLSSSSAEDLPKMPLKTENFVGTFIGVDIQSGSPPPSTEEETTPLIDPSPVSPKLGLRDSLDSKKSTSSSDTHSLGRRHGTPTRKVSFRTTTSPYNRKLLNPSGNKVAALTNKFNKLIQQDAGILEEVRKRGGYLHKSGGHVYKVIDSDGSTGSLRKKPPSSASGSCSRTDESSDDVSVGSKGSYRKSGVKKRPSLRKNLYRRPELEVNRVSMCVKQALEIFEPNQHQQQQLGPKMDRKPPPGRSKPKVPDKSEQVIQKTKELKCKTKPVQIETKSCDNSAASSSKPEEVVVLNEVPNSVSEDSINVAEERSEIDGNTQRAAAEEQVPPTQPLPEYSEVVKRTEVVVEVTPDKQKKDKKVKEKEAQKTAPQKQKSTVQKIYEKFTFRSTKKINLSGSERAASESQLNTVSSEVKDNLLFVPDNRLMRKSFVSSIEIPTINMEESQENSSDPADSKIVDAINSLNQKIDNLSKSFNDLCLNDSDQESEVEPSAVLPNNSFLFRSMSKISNDNEAAVSQLNIAQAINTVVINKSLSMDGHHFPCRNNLDRLSLNEKIPVVIVNPPTTTKPIENDYELVSRAESPKKLETSSSKGSTMSIDLVELTSKIESFVYKAKNSDSNVYQRVTSEEVNAPLKPPEPDTISINSYESFENYESIERPNDQPPKEEDTYEICNPPEPLPPRNASISPNDLLIPQPKRNLTASPKFLPKHQQTYQSNYEKIKYDQTPPRPPKPEEIPLPPRNNIPKDHSPTPSEEPIYEENIYDTIKSCDGLDYDDPNGSAEAIIKRPKAHLPPDSLSLISDNCYESIGTKFGGDYLRHHGGATLPRMGSISTLASDQITNSLYGVHTGGAPSLTPPSERGGSGGGAGASDSTSNSAEWTDISDDEDDGEGEPRQSQFIIVRKRNKTHQTPVWSRKVRHTMASKQHHHHQQDHPKVDDDSDHVYESLDSHGQSRLSAASNGTTHTFRNLRAVPVPPPHGTDPQTPGSAWSSVEYGHSRPAEENFVNDDDFDSFDSDNESDEDHHRKNDSGVDISNVKLPDPPASSGQVYALMQKIKSLGTLSKSEIAKGLHKLSKKKTSTSKSPKIFTGEGLTSPSGNEETVVNYENAPLPKVPKSKSKSFKLPLQLGPSKPTDDYENTDFLNPLAAITPTSSSPNGSALASSPASEQADKSILASISNSDSSNVSTFRKKSKSGKSLRSKLRKSLQSESSLNIGSSFNGSRSTFYVTDSLDVDSGIFNGSEPTSSSSNLNVAASERDQPNPTIYSPPKTPHKTPDADRRKSAGGGSPASRPTIPPPPPPTNAPPGSGDKKSLKNRKLGATSWYAECGVFKSESLKQAENELKNKERSTTSWYAEVGLYQTSGASVASSSESSGVSTGGEGGPGDDHSHSMFVNEPLYQIYNAAKLESLTRDIDAEITGGDTELYDDGYEKISDHGKDGENGGSSGDEGGRKLRPTAFELIEPNVGKLRTLWCEIHEVINSEILLTLTPTEKRLQEAKFEILTSEASYLKSLNLLRSHFINHPAFRDVKVLTSSERKTLFSNIIPVQECSDRLLCDLENCWQDNIMLLGLSHSIYKHAEKHFHVYVNYCENQAKIDRTLKNLKLNKSEFTKTLLELESDPVCCGLSLSSFLMLPMQRITRMRLLLDAVLQRLKTDDDEFQSWEKTFVLINRILTQCNDAAHRSEQMYEMETISRNIEFPTHIRPLAIVPCGIGSPGSVIRKLEKRGELVHLMWRGDDAKLTFGKKFSKSSIYAFLFTDLLVLTKKKSDETYLVTDYCPRALLTVNSGDIVPQLPTKEMQAIGKHLIIMTLLENHEGKTVEMIVSCPSETERERWLKVTEPLSSENPDEKIYEQWDCPQVIAVHPYQALQPDELDLDIKDVVNVHRKMADGWYEGERIRDGAVGWFPGNYTKEILTAHVRAKHIKQRHMLLSYTSKIIDTNTRTLKK